MIKSDIDILINAFDKLGIKYQRFLAGLDNEDPLVIMISDHRYNQCNFEFDREKDVFIRVTISGRN